MGIYRCADCGSENVEQKAWIDLNTEMACDSCSNGDMEDNWCRDCMEHCKIKYTEDESKS